MQTLTDIKRLLAEHGLRPKHRLGQNFLQDARKMEHILQTAALAEEDVVLEVGPGTGALTEPLLAAGARVVAVEIDRDLEPLLRHRLADAGDRFQLLITDILAGKHAIEPRVLAALHSWTDGPFKLIANLPYQIASPLLANLALDHPQMALAVVMVQKEVADRLAAPEGNKDYGPLSVIIQAMMEVTTVTTLPPACFWPQPKVTSAVVRLTRRAVPLTDDPASLSAFVHQVFHQRRKQLGSILGRQRPWPDGIRPDLRPEMLSVAQWVQLQQACGHL